MDCRHKVWVLSCGVEDKVRRVCARLQEQKEMDGRCV